RRAHHAAVPRGRRRAANRALSSRPRLARSSQARTQDRSRRLPPLQGLDRTPCCSRAGAPDALPARLDLAHERRDLVERRDVVLDVRPQKHPGHAFVELLEIRRDLAAPLLVEAHVQPLDDAERLTDPLALRGDLPALDVPARLVHSSEQAVEHQPDELVRGCLTNARVTIHVAIAVETVHSSACLPIGSIVNRARAGCRSPAGCRAAERDSYWCCSTARAGYRAH